ncbi:hypothetical protein HanPSC8_Chr04g0182181 [Helianthus annuus]|nr:hypothetical protein HanPSC8_Chr04g0182181 [Helianthus annuus]
MSLGCSASTSHFYHYWSMLTYTDYPFAQTVIRKPEENPPR